MKLNVIFEDQHLIVVEKPPKIPSQSDATNDIALLSIIKEYLIKQYNNAKEPYVALIHRLDRPVGGIMVYAKTKFAAKELSVQMQDKQFKKIYLGVACGDPQQKKGQLKNYLKKISSRNYSQIVKKDMQNAKEAVLNYEVIETVNTKEYGKLSLIRYELLTGRHHQIRVQTAGNNCPLWGDTKYNKTFINNKEWTQIALWAYQISFKHPKTKRELTFCIKPESRYPFELFECSKF